MCLSSKLQVVFKWFKSLTYNVDLTGFLSFDACLATHGAKDGVNGNSDWYHASKVHLLHLSIILDELLTLNFNIHAYVQNSIPNLMHICRGS